MAKLELVEVVGGYNLNVVDAKGRKASVMIGGMDAMSVPEGIQETVRCVDLLPTCTEAYEKLVASEG